MRNCSTSKRPLASTTLSKIRSMTWESIRWPSASKTSSNCMELPVYFAGVKCGDVRRKHGDARTDVWKSKNIEKTGVLHAFSLYIASLVPYDENDSRTQHASEACKIRGSDTLLPFAQM